MHKAAAPQVQCSHVPPSSAQPLLQRTAGHDPCGYAHPCRLAQRQQHPQPAPALTPRHGIATCILQLTMDTIAHEHCSTRSWPCRPLAAAPACIGLSSPPHDCCCVAPAPPITSHGPTHDAPLPTILACAQELGASILKDLHSQRETIVHSSNTLRGADDNITKARKILSNMARRLMQNKIIMAGVILFLVAAIALIIWAKVR